MPVLAATSSLGRPITERQIVKFRLEEEVTPPEESAEFRLVPVDSLEGRVGYIRYKGAKYEVQLYGNGSSLDPTSKEWKKEALKIVELLERIKALPQDENGSVKIDEEGNLAIKKPSENTFKNSPDISPEVTKQIKDFYKNVLSEPHLRPNADRRGSSRRGPSSHPLANRETIQDLQSGRALLNSTIYAMLEKLQNDHHSFKFQEIDVRSHHGNRIPSHPIPIKLFVDADNHPLPGGGNFNDAPSRDHFIQANGYYAAVIGGYGHFCAIIADIAHNTLFVIDPLSEDSTSDISRTYDLSNIYSQIFGRLPSGNQIRNLFNTQIQHENPPINCGVHCVLSFEQLLLLATQHKIKANGSIDLGDMANLIQEHRNILRYRQSWADRLSQQPSSEDSSSSSSLEENPSIEEDDETPDASNSNAHSSVSASAASLEASTTLPPVYPRDPALDTRLLSPYSIVDNHFSSSASVASPGVAASSSS